MSGEEEQIRGLLARYQDALNGSDTEAVMEMYAPDGVFMAQNSKSNVGSEAVRRAYEAVFGAITLTVKFAVEEVRQVAPEWAFARTNSAGTVLVKATGERSAEANQELFVLEKVGGAWKIARYCFSTTNP